MAGRRAGRPSADLFGLTVKFDLDLFMTGTALIDSSAGFADNEALATELLGFRPTRHAPLDAESTLCTPAPAPPTTRTPRTDCRWIPKKSFMSR